VPLPENGFQMPRRNVGLQRRGDESFVKKVSKVQKGDCTIHFDFNGAQERENQLLPLCSAVLAEFDLPCERLYVYVADSEDAQFTRDCGAYFRGAHISPEEMHLLPEYLKDCVFLPDDELELLEHPPSFMEMLATDHLIYIRNSTCILRISFAFTFAHELQHVMQYCGQRKILAGNRLLYHNLKDIDPFTAMTPIDIPHEKDASVVSKRVAEKVFGTESVQTYIESQINQFTDLNRFGNESAQGETARWKFLLHSDSSIPYNLTTDTIRLFGEYRSRITPQIADAYDLDLAKEEWWE
jgi:hypothetical protein